MTLRPPFTPITAEFYRQMPEGPPYYQLIEGNLVMSPSPNFYHNKILLRLSHLIEGYLDEHPTGELAIAPSDVFLDDVNVFQPDIYFVSNERRTILVPGGVKGAPDLVVEILSPSNMTQDRNEKRQAYARSGVKEMWIIDPELHRIEVHPLARGLNAAPDITSESEPLSPELFPGLQIDTARLFRQ